MTRQLDPGCYCGGVVSEWRTEDLVLTETVHPPRLRTPRHSHSRGYFCLLLRGSFTEITGKRYRDFGPRSLSFHPPDEEHSERIHDHSVSSFNVEVGSRWLGQIGIPGRALDRVEQPPAGRIHWLMPRLFAEYRSPAGPTALDVEGLVVEILREATWKTDDPPRPRTARWLKEAHDLIHDRLAEPLRLADIAAAVGVHPVYLATCFRRRFGVPVGEYLRRLRVDRAADELARSERPLVDVACTAGFYDQPHFTRTFKRYTGLLPTVYRSLFQPPRQAIP